MLAPAPVRLAAGSAASAELARAWLTLGRPHVERFRLAHTSMLATTAALAQHRAASDDASGRNPSAQMPSSVARRRKRSQQAIALNASLTLQHACLTSR